MNYLSFSLSALLLISSKVCASGESDVVPDLSRFLTLPSLDAVDYYETPSPSIRNRFSRPVRQVKFGGGEPLIPILNGPSSNSAANSLSASLNLGPIGASLSSSNAQSKSTRFPGLGYGGGGFGGPGYFGGPGFGGGLGQSQASASAGSSSGGGFFGGPSQSFSQASAGSSSTGLGGFGGGYPYGGGNYGYPGGYGGLGGGYGGGYYPGGGFGGGGYPGGGYLGGGYLGGGYPGGGYYPGGGFGGGYPGGLYPGGAGIYPGGAFGGYGRGGVRSGATSAGSAAKSTASSKNKITFE